jgi:hypothetical protein
MMITRLNATHCYLATRLIAETRLEFILNGKTVSTYQVRPKFQPDSPRFIQQAPLPQLLPESVDVAIKLPSFVEHQLNFTTPRTTLKHAPEVSLSLNEPKVINSDASPV